MARKVDPTTYRGVVERVVQACQQCQSIDTVSNIQEAREVHVSNNWERLVIDVMHYQNGSYLLMVDCRPGRIAIWQESKGKTGTAVASILNELFLERGPVEVVLMDNGTAFKSAPVKAILE